METPKPNGKTRAYLSGPMSNVKDLNFPLFDYVTIRLSSAGYSVFNPANYTRRVLGKKPLTAQIPLAIRRALLAYELNWIALHADFVFMLPDWQNSTGACAERDAAVACEIPVRDVPQNWLPDDIHHGNYELFPDQA